MRLEEMEDKRESLGWMDAMSGNNSDNSILDRSLDALERFKNSVD